ncbi:hypothetical protein [Microbacterium terricola]|uniref:DUF2510 domain-containing protein n=1 Tax=Microbacterium terricola TaxID=344163 RepID=A0ABM8E014_9MICO|nr:hypothetical protein [Microbacterium terricola]UYK40989.1 hypothetical protein OAU46_04920 [Microbacterium terricola]BDV31254.1 hypothetical protein Microterr_19140 [Microbacterium terricola]
MTPRRIRVSGVRGDFRTPPGWPTPTDNWIRANTFWQPPAEWTPLPGLKPAPKGWQFWTTNRTWDNAATKYYAPLNGWMRVFNIAAFASTATFIAAFIAHIPVLGLAAMLLFVFAFACLVVVHVRRRRMTAELITHATRGAERARAERLAREYQRYLVDAS